RPAELLTAIRTVAGGEAVLAPTATRRLLDQFAPLLPAPGQQPGPDAPLSRLTDRERAVFARLAAGLSNREIAGEMHLSHGTVKVHVGLSRPGARCQDFSWSVSPGRSPNPACPSPGTGLSTVPAIRRG